MSNLIKPKKGYREYLKKFKDKQFPSAPATAEDYADWWIEAIKEDLKDFAAKGQHIMRFHPYQKDGPLLILDEKGNIPEKYIKKFEGYKEYSLELNLNTDIIYSDDGNCKVVTIKVS